MCFVLQMGDVRDWASENDAIQALRGALTPVKDWVQVSTHAYLF